VSAPEPLAGPDSPAPGSPAPGSPAGGAASEKNAGQPPASRWDDPRLPWAGRPRAVDIACWAAITVSGLYYLALLPFRAALVGTHPIVLEVLNGSTEAIVAAAAFARVGHGTLLVVMLAAIPGLMKFDLLFWWAGRLWGEGAVALLGSRRNRGVRYINRVKRWGRKFTWPAIVVAQFIPIPNAIIYIVAGWAGVGLVTFLILDLIGTMLWAGMLVGLGYALGHHAVVVAQAISRYGLWFSIAIIALIILSQVRSARASRAGAAGQPTVGGLDEGS
jgi:membrane protein DedA with SNARE-associated domain